MYIFDKESQSKFGDSKHLPKNIADYMKFVPEIAWNRQLIAVIPYKATAALTNTYKYWYI